MGKHLITIIGPTAIGKTTLAIKIANSFKTEIVSADSRQFYKEMNIGTAKPSTSELNSIKHHLINNKSVNDDYNIYDYEKDALKSIESIFNKKDIATYKNGYILFIED